MTKSDEYKIRQIIEVALTTFAKTSDYSKALEYGIEEFISIVNGGQQHPEGHSDNNIIRTDTQIYPHSQSEIIERFTNEHYFDNEEDIG